MIDDIAASEEASLNRRRDWHEDTVIGTLLRAEARVAALPQEIRLKAQSENSKAFHEALKVAAGGRESAVQAVLARRAGRWSERRESLRVALWTFARADPPTELLASVLRTSLSAWCSTRRFAQPMAACRLCSEPAADSQQHYIACPILRMWIGERFGLRALPSDEAGTRWFLEELGRDSGRALKSDVMLDTALHAVDSKLDGAEDRYLALLDAGLKEARRRHRQVRSIPVFSWIPPALARHACSIVRPLG